jgi:hypothetical protein
MCLYKILMKEVICAMVQYFILRTHTVGHISVLHDHCVSLNCTFQVSAKLGKTFLIRIGYAYFTSISINVNRVWGRRTNNVLTASVSRKKREKFS